LFENFDFSLFIKTQSKDCIGFTYVHFHPIFYGFNEQMIGKFFKESKNRIKAGKMRCVEENNKTHTLGSTKYYSMCFQDTSLENNIEDAGAIHVFRYFVSGSVYFFNNKKNRDKMFEYVNK
jgi:hypothetical protein